MTTNWTIHLNVSPAEKTFYHREITVTAKTRGEAVKNARKAIKENFDFTEVEKVIITVIEEQ